MGYISYFTTKEMKSKFYRPNLFSILILTFVFTIFVGNSFSQSIDELLKEVNNRFYYKGAPIHPELLHTFNSSWKDLPIIMSVDIVSSYHSNMCRLPITINNKMVSIKWKEQNPYWGSFIYEYLGKLGNGIHIVKTSLNGGGSGSNTELLFVSIKIRSSYSIDTKPQEQLIMTLEKCVRGLHDEKITLEKNKVIIDKPVWSDKAVEVLFN